jgi:hypothetical protein
MYFLVVFLLLGFWILEGHSWKLHGEITWREM